MPFGSQMDTDTKVGTYHTILIVMLCTCVGSTCVVTSTFVNVKPDPPAYSERFEFKRSFEALETLSLEEWRLTLESE